MTLRGELQSMAMNEVRQKLRVAVEIAEAGSPLIILEHGHPAAQLHLRLGLIGRTDGVLGRGRQPGQL